MKFKRSISCILAAVTLFSVTACGTKDSAKDGKVSIEIGSWPDETKPTELEKQNKMKDDFMVAFPDIEIVPNTYKYDTKTFVMKASAKQLPNVYSVPFTDTQSVIKQKYAADITSAMERFGYDKAINPELLNLVKDMNGRIYGIPYSCYAQGLYINKKLFKEAGVVNEDGSVKVPDSYAEIAEFAKIIKEKTGKAGFIMPTTNNTGGWHFLNIAWSYGVEFCKQRDDGTWEATFDTQAARDALQYIKDLKWKYNALMDETVINQDDVYKYFGTYQGAMMFADPPCSVLSQKYDMNIEDIYATRMPKGPAGRFAQMGGGVYMFASDSTEEEINAGIEWIKFTGFSPEVTETTIANLRTKYEQTVANRGIVLDRNAIDVWILPETLEKTRAVQAEFANINHEDYEKYYAFEDVTINPEPSACAQQLYAILDGCIQEVLTNKDADVAALIKTANEDYQKNHLDKM